MKAVEAVEAKLAARPAQQCCGCCCSLRVGAMVGCSLMSLYFLGEAAGLIGVLHILFAGLGNRDESWSPLQSLCHLAAFLPGAAVYAYGASAVFQRSVCTPAWTTSRFAAVSQTQACAF